MELPGSFLKDYQKSIKKLILKNYPKLLKVYQFLSEIEAGEEAVNYIDQYIFKRIYYLNSGSEKKAIWSFCFN